MPDGVTHTEPVSPPGVGVGSWIERRSRVTPDAPALISGDRALTYAELSARIRRLAGGLRQRGVTHGDRVAWLGPNHPAFLDAFFACGLIGAVLAPANHRLESRTIRSILGETEPTVLIHHGAVDRQSIPRGIRHLVAAAGGIEELIAGSPDAPIDASVTMDDLCLLPHSSGTTGPPKAIMLSHANVTWNVVNLLSCADFRSDDVTVAVAPFFRVGGTGVNVLPVLFLGGTVVVPGDADAEEILRLIAGHRVTVGFGNPDSLEALVQADSWPEADLSSLRFLVTGGAPVPERLIRTFHDRDVSLLQGYGLSEAAPLALLLDPGRALEKIGSAGKPPLLVDTRIERPDGTVARAGETGELLVRGPNVMAGYWNRPEETRRALTSDGWLRTGDAARSDDEGYVWIVDRVADGFRSDGRLVYPGDVERVLMGHPSIADAGVVQIERAELGGQVVAAIVEPAPGTVPSSEDIIAFARGHLEPHEVPVTVTFVDGLPRSSVGKLARNRLREMASPS
jgi:fatty-acyl-CoA synthase